MKLSIDGSDHNGLYRVSCECGDSWSGEALRDVYCGFNPALPVAECVVHMRLVHPTLWLDIRFSSRFSGWLEKYWRSTSSVREAPPLQQVR